METERYRRGKEEESEQDDLVRGKQRDGMLVCVVESFNTMSQDEVGCPGDLQCRSAVRNISHSDISRLSIMQIRGL